MKTSSHSNHFWRSLPVVLALSASGAAFAQTPAASCEKTDEKQVAGLFDRWNASLKTLDADRVTANYAANGVLLATVANEPLTTPADIRGYFTKFLKGEPQGTINKRFVTVGSTRRRTSAPTRLPSRTAAPCRPATPMCMRSPTDSGK